MQHVSAPIVQAEFFLAQTSGIFDDAILSIRDRVEKGQMLKICVRFFDTRGLVTKAVLQACFAEARSKVALDMLSLSSAPQHQNEFGSVHQSASEEYLVRKNDLRRCVLRELRFVAEKKLDLAVEQQDHSYRPALEGEGVSLLKDIAKTTELWTFLFSPGHLLADSHEHIIPVM